MAEMKERTKPTHTIDDEDADAEAGDRGDREPLVQVEPAAEKENPFGARSRVSMFILLASIATSAILFGVKEQRAEDKIWKNDMQVVKNGTSIGDQKPMRYTTVAAMSWTAGFKQCGTYSGSLCNFQEICGKGGKALKSLCPGQRCVGLETPQERKSRLVPIAGRAPGSFVRVDTCAVETRSVSEEVPTAIACCGTVNWKGQAVSQEALIKFQKDSNAYNKKVMRQQEKKKLNPDAKLKPLYPPKPPAKGMKRGLLPVHQAPVIQNAVMKGKIAVSPGGKNLAGKGNGGGPKSIWEVQDHIRDNDPFAKAKAGGGKGMKSFHQHLASHLSNQTVATVQEHWTNVVGAMSSLVNQIKTSVKMEAKNQTATDGSITHSIRNSDPFMKGGSKNKIKPLHEHIGVNSTHVSTAISQHVEMVKNHIGKMTGALSGGTGSGGGAAGDKLGAGGGAESIRKLEVDQAKEEEKGEKAGKMGFWGGAGEKGGKNPKSNKARSGKGGPGIGGSNDVPNVPRSPGN